MELKYTNFLVAVNVFIWRDSKYTTNENPRLNSWKALQISRTFLCLASLPHPLIQHCVTVI